MSTSSRDEKELFCRAADLPAAERAAFLRRLRDTDPELAGRVEALLAAHARAGEFMSRVLLERPQEREPFAGDDVGVYHIVREIGEGGCGTVFEADQRSPVCRRVALKVIRRGMNTREVIARFQLERQALALLDHPGIAQMYDAGETLSGSPYFVMELVSGVPITDFCDRGVLSLRERLLLFIQVCHAIQHAHQKGIIHRDIKASNVLVTDCEGGPLAKVIDFGIAKAIRGPLADAQNTSVLDQLMGTPAYMSPEQAVTASGDVDTRSDVYSLGALLYELLAGQAPFDPGRFRNASVDEIRATIRETEPPKPSARLAGLPSGELAAIAVARATSPAACAAALRGDLDAIVMKALAKERSRRFQSASELAADVQRFLQHEPVQARSPGFGYVALRFTRRHRLAVVAAAVSLAAVLAGVVGVLASYHRTLEARNAAQAARAQAQDLVGFIMNDLRPRLEDYGRLSDLRKSAETAVRYFDGLPDALRDADTRAAQATALEVLASCEGGGEGHVYQSTSEAARRLYARALELRRSIAVERPRDAAAALAVLRDEHLLAFGLGTAAENAEVEAILRRYRELAERNPADPAVQRAYAWALVGRAYSAGVTYGRPEEGLESGLRGVEAWTRLHAEAPGDPDVAVNHATALSAVVHALRALGRGAEARTYADRAVEEAQAAVALDPNNQRILRFAGNIAAGRVYLLASVAPTEVSDAAFFGRAFYQRLIALDPSNMDWRIAEAHLELMEGYAAMAGARTADAYAHFQDVLRRLRPFEANDRVLRIVLDATATAGQTAGLLGRRAEAEAFLSSLRRHAPSGPPPREPGVQATIDRFHARFMECAVLGALEEWAELEKLAARMTAELEAARDGNPGCDHELVRRRAAALATRGWAHLQLGDTTAAVRELAEARAEFTREPRTGSFSEYAESAPWDAADDLAEALLKAGDAPRAAALLEESFARRSAAERRRTPTVADRLGLARVCFLLAQVRDGAARAALLREGEERMGSLPPGEPLPPRLRSLLPAARPGSSAGGG